jgi:hypothetical protein
VALKSELELQGIAFLITNRAYSDS